MATDSLLAALLRKVDIGGVHEGGLSPVPYAFFSNLSGTPGPETDDSRVHTWWRRLDDKYVPSPCPPEKS